MLVALDWFLLLFHSAFTLFNLTGWMFRKTRRAHLVAVLLTAASWLVLGAFYGWGYCFLTDWHWRVLYALGERPPRSYIKYLLDRITGLDWNAALVDAGTGIAFAVVFVLSIVLNLRDRRNSLDAKRAQSES